MGEGGGEGEKSFKEKTEKIVQETLGNLNASIHYCPTGKRSA
jgi:hypothetical protein